MFVNSLDHCLLQNICQSFFKSKIVSSRNCNGGKPWGLIAGQTMPKVTSPNPIGDKISDTIGHVAGHVTQRAVLQVVMNAQGHHPIRLVLLF